ncbi:MAG: rhomboid family intramembrane serine protease [Bacteroidales bacterium]|nr:rhomboid family intramembrane serine protease [Bacteroidales bacterium]MCF8404355.1 rhomboid family intramembrane serine protease [Bacteroidales bacterium]
MEQYRPTGFRILPPIVKNLLIINGLFFLGMIAFSSRIDLSDYLGLHYPVSPLFKPHQLVTYMFMHGGVTHILFNMFALWMFGNALENVWGPKRFLIYYMVTGIGAGLLHLLVIYIQVISVEGQLSPELIAQVRDTGFSVLQEGKNFADPLLGKLNMLYNTTTVGASGAVFGLLLGFGMLFPNSIIYLYFAIPVKAKYFVIGYGALELYFGFSNNPGDNIAHFAHLGGMIFGYFMIMYWKKR